MRHPMKKTVIWYIILFAFISIMIASCQSKKSKGQKDETIELAPSPFVASNAYKHIEKQLSFGARVPNTEGHRACAAYLKEELAKQSLKVYEQPMSLKAYDGTTLEAVNIIGSYRPEAQKRVMIFAHWDTRPLADRDANPDLKAQPIPGADDGASGVGVILEFARLLHEVGLSNIGVDLVLFDAEDYGVPEGVAYDGASESTWALGSQYWSKTPHIEGYEADFGILLDMVGAKDAKFYREYFSQESAGSYVSKVWNTAAQRGFEKYFINKMGGAITDDHYFVIKNQRIPCVNIINYNPNSSVGFAKHWHTHKDNLEIINEETLQAVGETVWQVLLDYDLLAK